jgi:cytochrome c553
MKKILVAFALAAVASVASASISGGSHDLTKATYGNGPSLPACQYCHTPHAWVQANVAGGPLWNRNASPVAIYTVYTSTGFTSSIVLGVASRVCLSCHDGNAMGQVNNGVAPATALVPVAAYAQVGTDLRDDHPVGVTYTVTVGQYKDISVSTNVKLYAGQVECATCHDPHGTSDGVRSGAVFARWNQTTVDLCAECHAK